MFVDWLADSCGTARLEKVEPQVDGLGTRVWKTTWTEEIPSLEDADQLALFPGTHQAYQDAADELFSRSGKAVPLKGKRVELSLSFSVGDPHATPPTDQTFTIEDLTAEIRQLSWKTTPAAKIRKTTVWLHSVPLKHAEALVTGQARSIEVSVRALVPPAFAIAGKPGKPEEGQLVACRVHGRSVCGIMIRTDIAGNPVVEDFGVVHPLEGFEEPQSLWLESIDDLDVEDHWKHYEQEIRSMGQLPSWHHLLVAATQLWSTGHLPRPTSGTMYLSAAVAGRAIDNQTQADRPLTMVGK